MYFGMLYPVTSCSILTAAQSINNSCPTTQTFLLADDEYGRVHVGVNKNTLSSLFPPSFALGTRNKSHQIVKKSHIKILLT